MDKGLMGVQLMMLKQEIEEKGVYPVLEKLHTMGFHAIEVSQIDMTPENIAQLQRARKELDIQVAAMSCGIADLSADQKYPGDTLERNFDKIVKDCKAVDCTTLRIGMLPLEYARTPEQMLSLGNILEDYAKELNKHDIDLYYHAHNFEFHQWQGKPILTHLKDTTKYLGFELDSHWIWRGGYDPVDYIKSFAGRVRLLHLKDYRIGLFKTLPAEPYDIFGRVEEFAEVGEGSLDMPAIIQAGLESGSEYFLIEQDDTYGRDVYESLRISRDNLIKMGYESWF